MSPTTTVLAHIYIQIAGAWLSVAVASLALLFTVGSFWWLNARQGKVRSFEPQSFAAAVTPSILRIRFPLVFYNTGAKPIIIQDLRLRFPEEQRWNRPLPWTTTRSQLKPAPDDNHAFPAVFSLPGRTAQQMFVEFGGAFPEVMPLARDYRVQIEAKLGHRKRWKPVVTFTLSGAHITAPDQYITYSNSRDNLTEDTIRKSEAVLEQIIKRLERQSSGM